MKKTPYPMWSVMSGVGAMGLSAMALKGSVVQKVFRGPWADRRAARWIEKENSK